jgi:large subunit ribosomal protein L18
MFTRERAERRLRIKVKVRQKVQGTPERPRFCVYRSLNHIYAQLIDDTTGKTLVASSTLSKDVRDQLNGVKGKIAAGKIVGLAAAKKALEMNIKEAVFDRGGFLYHGRVRAVADGAREGGLKF